MAGSPTTDPPGSSPADTVYDLYFDESGRFTDAMDGASYQLGQTPERIFASQLAGLVIQAGPKSKGEARTFLERAALAAGCEDVTSIRLHGAELKHWKGYDTFLAGLAAEVGKSPWQAVRMTNREKIRSTERKKSYLRMVAALVIEVIERLARKQAGQLTLRLWPAVIVRGPAEGKSFDENLLARPLDYQRAVDDALDFYALRPGAGDLASRVRITVGGLLSARRDDRLRICDFLSHGSHDNFRGRAREVKRALKSAFDGFDFTFTPPQPAQWIADLQAAGAYGAALRVLVETSSDGSSALLLDSARLAEELAEALGVMTDIMRNQQLEVVSSWLLGLTKIDADHVGACAAAHWLTGHVIPGLRSALQDESEAAAFCLSLHHAAMYASHEMNEVLDARRSWVQMEILLTDSDIVDKNQVSKMRALLDVARHLMECFEFERAGEFLSAVFRACPQIEQEDPHLFGDALVAWNILVIRRGSFTPFEDVAAARQTSDRMIAAAENSLDRVRSHLQRAVLETQIGDIASGRRHLGRALSAETDDLPAICEKMRGLVGAPRHEALHAFLWTLSTCYRSGHLEEFHEGCDAVGGDAALLNLLPELSEGVTPMRLRVLRQAAFVFAASGHWQEAHQIIRTLRQHCDGVQDQALARRIILISAMIDVATFLWLHDEGGAVELLNGEGDGLPGVLQHLAILHTQSQAALPVLAAMIETWQDTIDSILNDRTESPAYELLLLSAQF